MKKTLTVNLNSIVFNIDDDAYEVLNKYLSDIACHFSSDEEKDEIMADIEARIAELFNERLQRNKEVITLEDVQEIIGIMGNPSQFSGDDSDAEEKKTSKSEKKKRRPLRFYRDPENAILGGVASGLSAYTGIDVTILRIILVLLLFVGVGMMIPIYLLVWIVAPAAITPSQRLEMQGEDVTIENIKSEFSNAKNYVQSDEFKNSAKSVGQKLGEIFKWIMKAFLVFLGVIFGFVGFVIVAVLLFTLFAVIVDPMFLNGFIPDIFGNWNLLSTERSIMLIIALLLVIGCPIFLLIYWAIRIVSGRRDRSKTTYWVTLILWIAGLFMLISMGTHSAIYWKTYSKGNWPILWNGSENIDQIRDIAYFDAIDVSGNFRLNIEEAPNQILVVNTDENFIQEVVTEVINSTLYIHTNGISVNQPVNVSLSTTAINKITARGASQINTNSTIKSDNLYMLLQGASNANMDVDIQNTLQIKLEGASKINLQGNCETVKIRALGASKINSEKLKAANAKVYVAGASSASLYASKSLDADGSGAAKISCIGNPEYVNKTDHIGVSIRVR